MALITLANFRMSFTCNPSGNHVEVPHVMAWRCLMALDAVR